MLRGVLHESLGLIDAADLARFGADQDRLGQGAGAASHVEPALPGGTSSQSTNWEATALLHRPTYGSYRSPSCQASVCMGASSHSGRRGRPAYASRPWRTNATSGSKQSELRGEEEFTEFSSTDLPYYSDWRGSFEKLPWATDDEALRAANADVAIVGAPLDDAVSSRPGARFGPRAIRMAPTVWSTDYAWSIQSDVEPYHVLEGGRRRRRARGAGSPGTRPPRDPREGLPRGERRPDPDRPGRRSLGDVSERGRRRASSAPAEGRHRALRRARRHRHRRNGATCTDTARRCVT